MNDGAETVDFDLDSFLPYRLNRAAEWMSQSFAGIYRKRYGMTRPEWRTIAILGQHQQITATEICIQSTMHKTKVSRAVASLENRKWLRREQNMKDRREEWLELTAKGRQVYEDLAVQGREHDRRLVELLGKQNAKTLQQGLLAIEKTYGDASHPPEHEPD